MDPKRQSDGLDVLLQDVLAAGSPGPELLARYAEAPDRLSAEERRSVEEAVGGSAALADQLRVLRGFDPARLPRPETEPARPARERATAGWLAPLRRFAQALEAPPAVWIPAAAAAAALLALLSVRALEDTRRVTQLETELAATLHSIEVLRGDLERMAQQTARRADQVASLRRALVEREAALATAAQPAAPPDVAPEPQAHTPAAAAAVAATPPRASVTAPSAAPPAPERPEAGPAALQLAMNEPLVYARPADVDAGLAPQRSSGRMRSAGARLPEVVALAPDHVGYTVTPRPTLYWQLSERTDHDLVVTLVDSEAQTTLLEKRLPGPHRRGIGKLSLNLSGIGLKRDRIYQWFVSVLAGDAPGPDDAVAGGLIERVKKTPELDAEIRDAGHRGAAHVYARRGLWYDALNAVSRRIANSPRDERLRAQRDALLEQVGLDASAK